MVSGGRLPTPILFVCDIQTAFAPAIHNFPAVVSTATKLLRAASTLHIPVFVTTQNAARLGQTVPELPIKTALGVYDKTAFSMMVPELRDALQREGAKCSVAITGIETHICVTQTALDLLRAGHKVYIMADGVSSCNKQEIGVALDRLSREGAVVTTSESWIYEVMGNARIPEFKKVSELVKERKEDTKKALEALL